MNAPDTPLGNSFMVEAFRSFHGELVRLREMAAKGDPALLDDLDEPETDNPKAKAQAIAARLTTKLDDLSAQAERAGGAYAGLQFKDAQYVMAALADESFLHFVKWDGRRAWSDNLLETRLFGTFVAGERIFQRIEALLKKRDPAERELAAVYLLALALGFRGRYVGENDQGRLEGMRKDLYTFVNGSSLETSPVDQPLFAQSYSPPLSRPADRRLPHIRKWVIGSVIVVLVFVIAQHALWLSALSPLDKVIERSQPGSVAASALPSADAANGSEED